MRFYRWLLIAALFLIANPAAAVLVTVPCDAPYVNYGFATAGDNTTFEIPDFDSPPLGAVADDGYSGGDISTEHGAPYSYFDWVAFNAGQTGGDSDFYGERTHCFEVQDESFSYDFNAYYGQPFISVSDNLDPMGLGVGVMAFEYSLTDVTTGRTVLYTRTDLSPEYGSTYATTQNPHVFMGKPTGFLFQGRTYRSMLRVQSGVVPLSDMEVAFDVSAENQVNSSAGFSLNVISVPEPGTAAMMGAGVLGLLYFERRRRIDND